MCVCVCVCVCVCLYSSVHVCVNIYCICVFNIISFLTSFFFVFFVAVLNGGLSQELKSQQVSPGLQDFSEYSSQSQQCCGFYDLDSFNFQFLQCIFFFFKWRNYIVNRINTAQLQWLVDLASLVCDVDYWFCGSVSALWSLVWYPMEEITVYSTDET